MKPSRSTRLVSALLVLAGIAAPRHASAVDLIADLGGPAGFGVGYLDYNDDSSSSAIDISRAFPGGLRYFAGTYSSIYVNNNGNITFRGAVGQFTPTPFPIADQPMIAPFWADVDTRRSQADGPIGGSGYPGACRNDTDNEIWWALDTTGHRIVVTWYNTGYYNAHTDHRMSFQLILSTPTTCGGAGAVGNFDVEFRFNRCEWETGDASGGSGGFGGTQAQSGFDATMGSTTSTNFVSLPGSRMAGIAAALCRNSNVMPADAGVWRFTVRGGTVMCPNAGMPCDVAGMQGICAQGLTNCVGAGVACVQTNHPVAERCNGLDDNCNGMTDDGSGLCPGAQICVRGVCVDHCVEGSCFDGFTCDTATGVCAETACAGMTCPAGQVCRGGACRGPCDGITCPIGQVCHSGYCVDPCNGVSCPMDQVCEAGLCVPTCGPCRVCPAGTECGTSGACVVTGCGTVTCPGGQICQAGSCVDPCTGAVCPPGQACMSGACMDVPMMPDAGNPYDSGTPGDDVVTVDPDVITDTDASDDVRGDVRADARRDAGRGVNDATCACRTPGSTGSARMPFALLGAALAAASMAVTRRRRRR